MMISLLLNVFFMCLALIDGFSPPQQPLLQTRPCCLGPRGLLCLQRNAGAQSPTRTRLWGSLPRDVEDEESSVCSIVDDHSPGSATQINRRQFLAAATLLAGAAALVPARDALAATRAAAVKETSSSSSSYSLPWEANPVNRRSGVTVFDAEKAGYSVAFVTYLSRFLLTFDSNCQQWWFSTQIPRKADAEQVEMIRLNQFARFSASVEVGLQGFEGKDGPRTLLKDLVYKYGRVPDAATDENSSSSSSKAQSRLAKSARRHICLLFGLLEKTQPVPELTQLLASVDKAKITSVQLSKNAATGYDAKPRIEFSVPPPQIITGDKVVNATGRAILEPTGKLLRMDVVDGGSGYEKAPTVTISSPIINGTTAKAKAKLSKDGQGVVESIVIVDSGSGYTGVDNITVTISPPAGEGGKVAVAEPVLDQAIVGVEITNQGSGYAVEKPVRVYAGRAPGDGNATTTTTSTQRQQIGVAVPVAESSSFSSFRKASDLEKVQEEERQLDEKYNIPKARPIVSASDSDDVPSLPFWSAKSSSSSELLRLLPAGVGLEYDSKLKRYVLAVDSAFLEKYPTAFELSSNRPIGTEFGPRGRAPIERDRALVLGDYLRFGLSGAICASGVHLFLTPLDVVKTKVQVNPDKYPSIGRSFGSVFQEEGPSTFFTGWLPTFLGNFIGGGTLYAVTEIIRRSLTEAAGANAGSLEVPIILAAAAIASALGAVIICPFEAVRIRVVAQPDYAPDSKAVLSKMLKEEGIGSLVDAIPIFLVKNIPYAMTKFLIFDLSTERLFDAFPAAKEQLTLSLLVSLVGGILGGTAAAVVSNPADAVISELKKSQSDMSPVDAAKQMLERSGVATFFVGLPLRMVFYSLVASLTFAVYDGVRIGLGIGADDLKLYLDVLGGALGQSGTLA